MSSQEFKVKILNINNNIIVPSKFIFLLYYRNV